MSKYAHKLAAKAKQPRPVPQPYYCKQRIRGEDHNLVACGKLAEYQLFSGEVVCKGHRKNQRAIKLVIPAAKDTNNHMANKPP